MLIFSYASGVNRIVKGQTLRELDQNTARLGQVNFTTPKEYPFGECPGIAYKGGLLEVIQVADETYDAVVAKQKADEEAKKEAAEKKHAELLAAHKRTGDVEAVERHNADLIKRAEGAEARAEHAEKGRDAAAADVEQLRVQLGGCGCAALGATQIVAKQGDYGWSQAYQDVLDLRWRHDYLTAPGVKGWLRRAFWKRGRG